jgi:hypothetical protein
MEPEPEIVGPLMLRVSSALLLCLLFHVAEVLVTAPILLLLASADVVSLSRMRHRPVKILIPVVSFYAIILAEIIGSNIYVRANSRLDAVNEEAIALTDLLHRINQRSNVAGIDFACERDCDGAKAKISWVEGTSVDEAAMLIGSRYNLQVRRFVYLQWYTLGGNKGIRFAFSKRGRVYSHDGHLMIHGIEANRETAPNHPTEPASSGSAGRR